jgi:hypothetical protein
MSAGHDHGIRVGRQHVFRPDDGEVAIEGNVVDA